MRLGALYGKTALKPIRKMNENWEDAYQRLCIDTAPAWIAERAKLYRELCIKQHSAHSNLPILELSACPTCSLGRMSWKAMTENMYLGDPFLQMTSCDSLGYVEPEVFRPGAGSWDGKPLGL